MTDKNITIIRNTGMLYARSLICFVLSFFTSRLVLKTLGVEDFGIYNAVGGFVSMFWVVASVLTSAIGRFMNVEKGKNDEEALKEVFSMSLTMMIILALVAVILAEYGGIWFLTKKMTIPPERMTAATWIFHMSVLSMALSFLTIPYDAIQITHEIMSISAFINVLQAVLNFGIALLLMYVNFNADTLILYAVLMTSVVIFIRVGDIFYSRARFEECRFRLTMNFNRLKEMLGFAWWNFVGSIAGVFHGQGVNMALNVYHGPVLNTARGLANTVNNSVGLLVYNFSLSMKPQIMQSYARGEINRTNSLVFKGTKWVAYLMLLFSIPLCLETPFVLRIWLTEYPAYTVPFVRLSLIISFISSLDTHFISVKMATGKVMWYQIITSFLVFINFPLSVQALRMGADPVWVYIFPIFTSLVKIIVSIESVRNDLCFRHKDVLYRIALPILSVIFLSLAIPVVLFRLMDSSWLRFLLIGFTSIAGVISSCFFIGCTKDERYSLVSLIKTRFTTSQEYEHR